MFLEGCIAPQFGLQKIQTNPEPSPYPRMDAQCSKFIVARKPLQDAISLGLPGRNFSASLSNCPSPKANN